MQLTTQGRIVAALGMGRTLAQAAAEVGVDRTTVYRVRRTNPPFDVDVRRALAQGKSERKRLAKATARERMRRARVVVPIDKAPTTQDVLRGIALHFGRYQAWSTFQVARHDLNYSLWLLARLRRGTKLRTSLRDAVLAELGREVAAERFGDLA
jgi:hypothetical protein